MKKSVVIVAIVFFILGIIVGKNLNIPEFKDKSKNFETKTDNEEIGNVDKFIINDEWMKIGNFKCKKITESIDINFSKKLFITKDNELYTYSTDKIFSNGENYKKIETDIKFQRFIGNNALVDVDNNLYTYKDEEI